jgi:hypothetical protein
MKKIVRISLVLLSFAMMYYNVSIKLTANGDGFNLTTLQNMAFANTECVLNVGDQISGTHCFVTNVHMQDLGVQYQFDTFWCTATCPLGGTHCCYELEVRGS